MLYLPDMRHILRSTLIIAVFFALAKVFSFVRQLLVARQFGLGSEIDAFNAANNLPDLLAALISGGALAIAFIPVLTEYLAREGRPQAWALFSRIANLAFLLAAGASLALALLAGPLVRWEFGIAPGFTPEKQALAASLMRLDLIGTLIFSISGLVSAGLQANQHFLLPAMAPALYSLGQIFGVVMLAPLTGYRIGPLTLPAFGLGIYGLVYGVLLGAALHLLIQVPGLLRFGFRWTPSVSLRDPGVRRVLALMAPSLLAMFFFQLNFVARDNLASRLQPGAVTALTYGWFIQQMPQTLIGTAIAIALLPTLSEQIARQQWQLFTATLSQALRVLLALTLPAAALLTVAIRPLVQIIFDFDQAGTELMVWTTRAYLGGIVGYSLVETAVRSFYAQKRPLPPLVVAGARMLAYVLLSRLLFRRLGPPGIGLADTLVVILEGCTLFYLLGRGRPGLLRVEKTLLRIGLASAGSALVVAGLLYYVPLSPLPLSLGALALGGLVLLPFIWPEVKILARL